MTEFVVIRNPKADNQPDGTNVVFDYITIDAYKHPSPKQEAMIREICDFYFIVQVHSDWQINKIIQKGDRVYRLEFKELKLHTIKQS